RLDLLACLHSDHNIVMSPTPPSAVGPDFNFLAPRSPSDVGADIIGTYTPDQSPGRYTTQCPHGLCQPADTNGSVKGLESHHRHFIAHKALWEKERKNLLDKIMNLEERVRQYTFPKGSDIAMPDVHKIALERYGSIPTTIQTSCLRESAGNQPRLREPAQSNTVPETRTSPKSVAGPLATISEKVKTGQDLEERYHEAKASYQFSNSFRNLKHRESTRSKTTASSLGSRSAQSPRSTAPSSLSQKSPPTPVLEPVWTLQLPPASKENMIKHAGHTPMARIGLGLDGAFSDLPTPTKQLRQDAGPLEPQPSAKPPSERSDSYFPSDPVDDDSELQQPLTLKNEDTGNDEFMSQLQSKLQEAATNSSPPVAA
ncbi:MAG: hypothetical protein Q9226_009318, partial [Calogaya cf. arnoldii]